MSSPIKIEENPIATVVLTQVISAIVGGIIAVTLGLLATTLSAVGTGPLFILFLPAILAGAVTAYTWVIIGAPILAVIGGYMNANNSIGSSTNAMGVTFFSEEHPIYKKVQELAEPLNLPPIKHVGWFKGNDINAFAMGLQKENALLAFSQGAIDKLTKEEFDAVVAHELAHVANGDMRNMTFARGAQEALTFFLLFRKLKKFARWIFSPIAELKILSYSRQREFAADNIGAQLVSPQAMIGALSAIENDTAKRSKPSDYDNLKFASALSSGIWHTHPPISKRIKSIEALEAKQTKHSTFPTKPIVAPPLETEVVIIKEIPTPEAKEIKTYKPWASVGLMSFGS